MNACSRCGRVKTNTEGPLCSICYVHVNRQHGCVDCGQPTKEDWQDYCDGCFKLQGKHRGKAHHNQSLEAFL